MSAYFKRVAASGGTIFTGGIGWVDRSGDVVASSSGGAAVDVADRVYFKRVTATGKPYISAGLIGRKLRQPIVVVAVPTRDAAGRLTGMLTGRDPADDARRSAKQTQPLGIERPDDRRPRRAASALGPDARLEPGAARADPDARLRGTSPTRPASRADNHHVIVVRGREASRAGRSRSTGPRRASTHRPDARSSSSSSPSARRCWPCS